MKLLYAFCREFHVLPSQAFNEDPVIMAHMLDLFAEEQKSTQKALNEMKRR